MNHPALPLVALLALSLVGCGVSSLDATAGLASAVNVVAESTGERVNADFTREDKACLFSKNGAPATTPQAEQDACLARVRTTYGPVLDAFEAYQLVWAVVVLAMSNARAAVALGQRPSLASIEAALPDLNRAADALADAYLGMKPGPSAN